MRALPPIVVTALLAGLLYGGSSVDHAPRQTMSDLANALATVFAISLSPEPYRDAANRDLLRTSLQGLAEGSEELSTHGTSLGAGTERLRVAMAREAQQALSDFEAGRFEPSQRSVHRLLDHCFACHTRVPAASESALGRRVAQGVNLQGLELKERVLFLVATRQFERALTTIETALRSPAEVPSRVGWLFEDYLKLSIRVHRSYGRAREALVDFLDRPDPPPPYLVARVRVWIRALDELEGRGKLAANLSTARSLIEEGRLRNEFPADSRGLVHFVAASGLLLQLLEVDDDADAYFLLGVAESHISWTLWTDQTEFYLETAIRSRPHSRLSAQAYSFLQEYVIAKHSSASGIFVPDAELEYLDDLRTLAEPAPVQP